MAMKGDEVKVEKRGEALLLNRSRRAIFTYLTKCPCSRASQVIVALSLSSATVRWHLSKLMKAKYVSRQKKTLVYYPTNLVAEEDLRLLSLLAVEHVRAIYRHVLENPGTTCRETAAPLNMRSGTASAGLNALVGHNLLTAVRDGKYKRYYPTGLIEEKSRLYRKRSRSFLSYVMNKIREEGFSPKIIRSSGHQAMIGLSGPKAKIVITIYTNPFVSMFI